NPEARLLSVADGNHRREGARRRGIICLNVPLVRRRPALALGHARPAPANKALPCPPDVAGRGFAWWRSPRPRKTGGRSGADTNETRLGPGEAPPPLDRPRSHSK